MEKMEKTKSNNIMVASIDQSGVLVAVDEASRRISWDDLRLAAGRSQRANVMTGGHDCQGDGSLAAAYSSLLADAEEMAADGPVVVSVDQDDTHVWWVAGVSALYGGGRAKYHRRRDEGGTHATRWLAAQEALDICERLGARVARREGF